LEIKSTNEKRPLIQSGVVDETEAKAGSIINSCSGTATGHVRLDDVRLGQVNCRSTSINPGEQS
jgi:hypothetical protein